MDTQLQQVKALAKQVRADLLEMYPPSRSMTNSFMMSVGNGWFRFFDEDFCGACAVASYMLYEAARLRGIQLEYVGVMDHFWCELNGKVIDPTYSQFDSDKPIYIGKPKGYHKPVMMDFPDKILRRKKGRLEVQGTVSKEGVYKGDLALWAVRMFPDIQNPLSKYHRPKIKKWVEKHT